MNKEKIKEVQTVLKDVVSPPLVIDGIWGRKSEAALDVITSPDEASVPAPPIRTSAEVEYVDDRSERTIATLHPKVQPVARELIRAAVSAGIKVKAISGLRSYGEQDALYEQGRSRPGRIVTNARGGYSNHNFGIAFDVGIFEDGRYVDNSPMYRAVGTLGKSLGLEWGGDWKSIQDDPHFQLRPEWAKDMSERDMLAGLRARKASGHDYFA